MSVTKAELVSALCRMHSLTQEMFSTYANDVQPDRATKMEALLRQADDCSKVLHRLPFDDIQAAVSRYPQDPAK